MPPETEISPMEQDRNEWARRCQIAEDRANEARRKLRNCERDRDRHMWQASLHEGMGRSATMRQIKAERRARKAKRAAIFFAVAFALSVALHVAVAIVWLKGGL